MLRWVKILAAMVATSAGAQADLNAPVIDHPTVGSEIRRGVEAYHCDALATPVEESHCLNEIVGRYTAVHAAAEPFELGLYYMAWVMRDAGVQAETEHPDNEISASKLVLDLPAAKGDFWVLRSYQKKVGVTDEQLRQASGLTSPTLPPRWQFYLGLEGAGTLMPGYSRP